MTIIFIIKSWKTLGYEINKIDQCETPPEMRALWNQYVCLRDQLQ